MNRRLPVTVLPVLALVLLPGLLVRQPQAGVVVLQDDPTPTPSPTPTATDSPTPTQTSVPPTETPASGRPIVVVESYSVSGSLPSPGKEFTLSFRLANTGGSKARSVVASFGAGDFVPGGNGGVVSGGTLAPGASTGFSQSMFAGTGLSSGSIGLLNLTVSYADEAGTAYSETFNLGIAIGAPTRSTSGGARGTPTPTPTPVPRPLLIVVGHQSDPAALKPGTEFELVLEVHNFGGGRAERISMVVGGGSSVGNGGSNADGATNGGGDFTTFAPLGSSNIQFLGDLDAGKSLKPAHRMIVSGSTKAGVYVMKLSFSYMDDNGKSFTDEQVISLLVRSAPLLDVSFYRPLEPLFAGQPASLPIQVVNLDRTNTQLGRMSVSYNGLALENGEAMIGYLDPGGYFTLDPMWFPDVAGQLPVLVSIGYVDDFNQMQTFSQELLLNVEPMPEFPEEFPPVDEGGGIDGGPVAASGGFWQSLWRAILGLLGLDSGTPGEPMPGEGEFVPSDGPYGPPG